MTLSGVGMNLADDFVVETKAVFPDHFGLYDLLDKGSVEAELVMEQICSNDIDPQVFLDAYGVACQGGEFSLQLMDALKQRAELILAQRKQLDRFRRNIKYYSSI